MEDGEDDGVGEEGAAVGVGGVVAAAGVSFGAAPIIGGGVGLATATPETAGGLATAIPETAGGLATATPETAGGMAIAVPVSTAPRVGVLPICVGRVTATGEPEGAAGTLPLAGIAGALASPRSTKPKPRSGVGDGRTVSDGVTTGVAPRGTAVGVGPSREQPTTSRLARAANMNTSPGDGRAAAASGIQRIAGCFHTFSITTDGSVFPMADYTLDSLRLLCVSGSTRNSMGVSCVILIGSSVSWRSMSRR